MIERIAGWNNPGSVAEETWPLRRQEVTDGVLQLLQRQGTERAVDVKLLHGKCTVGRMVSAVIDHASGTPLQEKAAGYPPYSDNDAQFVYEASHHLFANDSSTEYDPQTLLTRVDVLRQVGPMANVVDQVARSSQTNGVLTLAQREALLKMAKVVGSPRADRLLGMAVVRPLREELVDTMVASVIHAQEIPVVNLFRSSTRTGRTRDINIRIQRENINSRVPSMTHDEQEAVSKARSYSAKAKLRDPLRLVGRRNRANVEALHIRAHNSASRQLPKMVIQYKVDECAAGENSELLRVARHIFPFAFFKICTALEEVGFVADERHMLGMQAQTNFANAYGRTLFACNALENGRYDKWCEEYDIVCDTVGDLDQYVDGRMRVY